MNFIFKCPYKSYWFLSTPKKTEKSGFFNHAWSATLNYRRRLICSINSFYTKLTQVKLSSQWTFLKWPLSNASLYMTTHTFNFIGIQAFITYSELHSFNTRNKYNTTLSLFHLIKWQKAPNYRMIGTWNSLPNHFRPCETMKTFKHKLKKLDFATLSIHHYVISNWHAKLFNVSSYQIFTRTN